LALRGSAAGGGQLRDDGALHAPGRSGVHDRRVDWPRDDVPQRRLRRPGRHGIDRDGEPGGHAFYAFGLVVLPTLAFIGLVTFERVLQPGIEDRGYAWHIARVRGYYFDQAPELTPFLLSVPPEARLQVQGLWGGRWQGIPNGRGHGGGDHRRAVAVVTLSELMRYQRGAWYRAGSALGSIDADEQAQAPTEPGEKPPTRRQGRSWLPDMEGLGALGGTR
jgi:hypothetical protein